MKPRAKKAPRVTPAAQEYLEHFKRWPGQHSHGAFASIESDVGGEVMLAVVRWAIKRDVRQISRLDTAARSWKLKPAGKSESQMQSPVAEWRRRRKEK